MKLVNKFKSSNKKLLQIKNTCFKICLLLALFSAMILSLYSSTYILFEFNLGITLLKLSITLFVSASICYIAFSQILRDIE